MSTGPKPTPQDPKRLTWWPNGYCSGWDSRKKACYRGEKCLCLKKKGQP